MITLEIILLIIAYTFLSITIFLEIICYKKNIEFLETIALTISFLLLIISLTISPLIGTSDTIEATNIFTLLSMVLVGLTTPLNALKERKHNLSPFWKKSLFTISVGLFLVTIIGYFTNTLNYFQYLIISFLVISIVSTMLFVRRTKPQKRFAHLEKIERIFSIAFIVVVPLSILATYLFTEESHPLKIGLTLPLLFILLAANKIWDDLQRLSLFNSNITPKEQHLKNFSLTEREKEIATILTKGKTYKQIAEELHISMPTVKTHASNIYKKCGVKSRSELTILLIS